MNDPDHPGFCTECGAPLRESDTFCTSCGAEPGNPPSRPHAYAKPKTDTLMIAGILSLISAVLALVIGTYYILDAEAVGRSIYETRETGLWDAAGFGLDTIVLVCTAVGALLIVSGVLALIAAAASFVKRSYAVALTVCIISAVLGLMMLVGIIGFVAAYVIYKAKNDFKDNKRDENRL